MSHKNEERKTEILEFVNEYIASQGASPTIGEICARFDIAKATAFKYISRLIDEGEISKNGRYRMSTSKSNISFKSIPVIGSVACGKPKLAVEDIVAYVPVSAEMTGGADSFALIASGDSMIDAGISDGDIVYVIRQSTADDGDIVVALIEDDITGESIATLKRIFRDDKSRSFILHPENKSYDDIIVKDVNIVGVAIQVVKKLK